MFLDESIFKEQTGWRHRGYGPLGSEARYSADVRRGSTWSILAAMTVDGYFPIIGIKGYFKTFDILNWLKTGLLPALRRDGRRRVICLNNASTHVDKAIVDTIETEGYLVRFLSPYSPDFSLIELSFSVLKTWIQRNYVWTCRLYRSFGDWLAFAVVQSRCDRFAREQYKYVVGGVYLEEGERERFFVWIKQWEGGSLTKEVTEHNLNADETLI